jgi:hypothetical protein
MRHLSIATATLLLSFTAAFAADPAGFYQVEGTNPGGGGGVYRGTVTVERIGENYRVVWLIAGERYVGTGIGNRSSFAVSYRYGNTIGIALYAPDGDDWVGVWTYENGRSLGQDNWTRR